MTTSFEAGGSPPRRTSTRRLTGKIAALAAVVSLGLAAGLSWEISRGADPALRPHSIAAMQAKPTRRIVKTVVIRRVSGPSTPGPSAPAAIAVSTAAASPAPVTSGSS